MNKTCLWYALGLAAVSMSVSVLADFTVEDVENSFFPYRNGTPEYPGYEPGMVINESNVEQFKEILDPGM